MRLDLDRSNTACILDVKLSTARENHTSQLLYGRYIVVIGGWNGYQSLSHPEVFEIVEEGQDLRKIKQEKEIKSLLARNKPASLLF